MLIENLQKLSKTDDTLSELLETVEGLESLEWCETRKGEPNLVDRSGSAPIFMHSSYNARQEAERHFASLDLRASKILYIYGLGTGLYYDVVKPWLEADPERYLVFLEDDLRVLRRVMETEQAGRLLDDPQVLLVWVGDDRDATDSICQDLAAYFIGLVFEVVALPAYDRERAERFDLIRLQLMHHAAYLGFAGQEFMDYGVRFFNNFYRNLLDLPEEVAAKGFYGAFEGVPAIICGAGPSLEKNIDILKTLEERALIFAGGSAINALKGHGLVPHLGGSVDPNPLQYERMKAHKGQRLPIFVKGRTYWKALEVLEGPRVYLAGNNLYPVTDWFEEQLGIKEPIATEGYNVLHLLIDVARLCGCNPIIFVGMDLAFTGMRLYADTVTGDGRVSQAEITSGKDANHNAFERMDIEGNPVMTLWKWVAESEYTARYARTHTDFRFINATEGGLGFEGIPNVPLAELADTELSKIHNPVQQRDQLLEQGRYTHLSTEKICELYDQMDDSLTRCIDLCGDLYLHFDAAMSAVKKGKARDIQTEMEIIAGLEEKLSAELAHKQVLEPVNRLRSIIHERKFDQIDLRDNARSDMQRMLRRCEANQLELRCLRECAEVNRAILRQALQEHSQKGVLI